VLQGTLQLGRQDQGGTLLQLQVTAVVEHIQDAVAECGPA
jgi:hypothetical protein